MPSNIDAHQAIRRAIAAAETAEHHLDKAFVSDAARTAAAHAHLAQAWAAIAQELTFQAVQLPGAWDAIDQAEAHG